MLVGDPMEFAVSCEVVMVGADQTPLGHLCVWAGGEPVGDFAEYVPLPVWVERLHAMLWGLGVRSDDSLDGRDKDDVLDRVWRAVYGDHPDWTVAEDRRYRPFLVLDGSETFDRYLVVLLDV